MDSASSSRMSIPLYQFMLLYIRCGRVHFILLRCMQQTDATNPLHSRYRPSHLRVVGCCTVCTASHITVCPNCMEHCHSRNFRTCLVLLYHPVVQRVSNIAVTGNKPRSFNTATTKAVKNQAATAYC
jgi:hypothetical protein